MDSKAEVAIAIALCGGLLFGVLIGAALGGSESEGISYLAARTLGEEIARGLAQSSCIAQRGEWWLDECKFPKVTTTP